MSDFGFELDKLGSCLIFIKPYQHYTERKGLCFMILQTVEVSTNAKIGLSYKFFLLILPWSFLTQNTWFFELYNTVLYPSFGNSKFHITIVDRDTRAGLDVCMCINCICSTYLPTYLPALDILKISVSN